MDLARFVNHVQKFPEQLVIHLAQPHSYHPPPHCRSSSPCLCLYLYLVKYDNDDCRRWPSGTVWDITTRSTVQVYDDESILPVAMIRAASSTYCI